MFVSHKMYIGSLEHVLLVSYIQELMYWLYRENLFICMVTGWPKTTGPFGHWSKVDKAKR